MYKKPNIWFYVGIALLSGTLIVSETVYADELEDLQNAYNTDWSNVEHEIDTWVHHNHPHHPRNSHENVRVWWKSDSNEVTFRVEALTKGYVGVGLIKHNKQNKKIADLMVGWVKDGEAVIQDRYETSQHEYHLDRQQNVELVAGFENETHTTLIFKRKHDTCDRDDDIAITNDTTRIFYILHVNDPVDPKAIFQHKDIHNGTATVLITSRPASMIELSSHWSTDSQYDQGDTNKPTSLPPIIPWDLINYKVELSRDEESLFLCKVHQLPGNISVKHHVIGYEPIVQKKIEAFLHRIFVYSCHPTNLDEKMELDDLSKLNAERCFHHSSQSQVFKKCHTLFTVWSVGSKGILFPENVGLALDPEMGPSHLYVETHYHNLTRNIEDKDNSGIRLWCSPTLRPIEAGVMSLGIEPNWKHIVPPMTSSVISYGHCVGQCTSTVSTDDHFYMLVKWFKFT
ncbi:DBH-like monooxygenase protein 1, variant 2 [Chamberlinius hualienensis]